MSLVARAMATAAALAAGVFIAAAGAWAAEPAVATAHDPHFKDKGLWPADVEKTAYSKEIWPKATLMVWARTDGARGPADVKAVANWLVDGKAATSLPNRDTDVYFPDGKYAVQGKGFRARHVTVGQGVQVAWSVDLQPVGNFWIKRGGSVASASIFKGDKNVFIRNDNLDFTKPESALANKILICRGKNSSAEIIGVVKAWDEFSILSGTLIVGPGAELVPGDRSVQNIYPDAKLILMSGSKFYKRANQPWDYDVIVAGELLAGTPERPLTEDCTIGLSWRRKGRGPGEKATAGRPNDYGLVVRPDGKMYVYSADPNKARLVITWNGLKSDSSGRAEDVAKIPPDELRACPRKVDMVFQGDVALSAVRFDCVLKGGIMMADPSLRAKWNVAVGDHNEAPPDGLFAALKGKVNPNLDVGYGYVEMNAIMQNKDPEP